MVFKLSLTAAKFLQQAQKSVIMAGCNNKIQEKKNKFAWTKIFIYNMLQTYCKSIIKFNDKNKFFKQINKSIHLQQNILKKRLKKKVMI